jgi:hypothetical protein
MANPLIQIGNEVREMNEQELAQHDLDKAEAKKQKKINADRALLKEATLTKLGLTEDEVAALLS